MKNYTLPDYRKIVSESFDPFNQDEVKAHEERVYEVVENILSQGRAVSDTLANMIMSDMMDLIDLYSEIEEEEEREKLATTISRHVLYLVAYGFITQAQKISTAFLEEK